jgi:hypothetical protein
VPITLADNPQEVVMADQRSRKKAEKAECLDETEIVLHALQELMQTVTSPIVKTCLEEAHEDIVYLTSSDPPVAHEHSAVA